MDRRGNLPGGLISEVVNAHSRKPYMVSTAPEIGEDYWTTAVLPVVQRKTLFGLVKANVPDVRNQLVAFIRNNMKDAHQAHKEVRNVVMSVAEEGWFDAFPRPAPADGYSAGARRKLTDMLGHDPL